MSVCCCVHSQKWKQAVFFNVVPKVNDTIFVFAEFCREVSDIQMPHVAPLILPEMYKIFVHADVRLKNK